MTPTTAADKVKEIVKSFLENTNQYSIKSTEEKIDQWLTTLEGSRLVGELGEDRLERAINWLEVQSTNEIINLDYRRAYAMTYEVLKKHFKIN